MKIDDQLKKTGLGISTTQARANRGADKAAVATSTPTPAATDSVHVSSQLQALTGGNNGVFDAKKVEEIKTAIAEGRFQVDPEKVANGLMDTVNDLLHSRKA